MVISLRRCIIVFEQKPLQKFFPPKKKQQFFIFSLSLAATLFVGACKQGFLACLPDYDDHRYESLPV